MAIRRGRPLPFADGRFDMVVCDHVFEHLDDPAAVAAELDRVLRHRGWICARTPNRNGDIAWGARLVPNGLHAAGLLRPLQPGRQPVDVFPTRYRLNTRAPCSATSQPTAIAIATTGSTASLLTPPGRASAWSLLWVWSSVAPEALCATWFVFSQKEPTRD